jgi:quinol monooxygenase YgiN
MIVITGAARVAEKNRAAFEKVAERQVTLSRQESGNVSYSYFEDRMEPGRFFFYEEWKDRAAVDFHFAQSYCHEFMDAARRLAETEPDLTIREIMVKER